MLDVLRLNKPYLLTAINAIASLDRRRSSFRGFIFLLLCSAISIGLYYTTRRLLIEVDNISSYIYLPYEQILGLFLLFLLFALTISNLAISLGRLYHSNDLDLFLAAPVRFSSLFFARFWAICLSSTWMPILFLFPVLLAFMERAGQNSLSAWAVVVVIFLPYFVLPTACSILIATVFLYFSPRNYGRLLTGSFIALSCWMVFRIVKLLSESGDSLISATGIFKAVNMLALPQIYWLPTNWVARCFSAILNDQQLLPLPEFQLLFLIPLLTTAVAYIVVVFMFDTALERERGAKSASTERASFLIKFLQFTMQPGRIRALLFKEYALIVRETAQVVQILLLLLLGYLYIYNLETLASATEFTARFDAAWTRFLAIVSLAVGCFFVLAISTRIIFPSISMEGRTFWFLMSRPLIPEQILQIKFWIWFIPLAILSAVFFVLGALALQISAVLIPAIAVFGIITAYGVVGLAVGMGARFANFDWEYSTQLVASFGSILYMLTAIALVTISCIPLGLLVALASFPGLFARLSDLQQFMALMFVVLGIWLPHILAVSWSFDQGIQELKARLS